MGLYYQFVNHFVEKKYIYVAYILLIFFNSFLKMGNLHLNIGALQKKRGLKKTGVDEKGG